VITQIVYGLPTTGKSTMVRYLRRKYAPKCIAVDTDDIFTLLNPSFWARYDSPITHKMYEKIAKTIVPCIAGEVDYIFTNLHSISDLKYDVGFGREPEAMKEEWLRLYPQTSPKMLRMVMKWASETLKLASSYKQFYVLPAGVYMQSAWDTQKGAWNEKFKAK
jgi:hypothetical protein